MFGLSPSKRSITEMPRPSARTLPAQSKGWVLSEVVVDLLRRECPQVHGVGPERVLQVAVACVEGHGKDKPPFRTGQPVIHGWRRDEGAFTSTKSCLPVLVIEIASLGRPMFRAIPGGRPAVTLLCPYG